MEKLLQRYVRYFYIALMGFITVQLFDVVSTTLRGEGIFGTITLIGLSITNLFLLTDSMRRNKKQQFTQGKMNLHFLRFTVGLRMLLYAVLVFRNTLDWVVFGEHIMTLLIIEVMLTYRIKHIEHLEDLVDQYKRDNTLN